MGNKFYTTFLSLFLFLLLLPPVFAQEGWGRDSLFIGLLKETSVDTVHEELLSNGFALEKNKHINGEVMNSYVSKLEPNEKVQVLFEKATTDGAQQHPIIHYWPSTSDTYHALKEKITKKDGYKLKNAESERKYSLFLYGKGNVIVGFRMPNNIKNTDYTIIFMWKDEQ